MKLAPLLWAGLGIIMLAIVGFLPSILVIIVLIGILITCYGLTQAFPAKAKLIGQIITLIIVFGLLINGYVYFIKPRSPMTQESLGRAQIAADLVVSLKADPNMLEARLGSADQLRWAQKALGEEFFIDYKNIREKHLAGKISAKKATEETMIILEQVKVYNEKMADATAAQADLKIHFRLMLIAVPLLVIALIPQILLPGKRFLGGVGTILLVAGFVLWAFPEIKNVFSRSESPRTQYKPPSFSPQKFKRPPPPKPPTQQSSVVQPPAVSQIPPTTPAPPFKETMVTRQIPPKNEPPITLGYNEVISVIFEDPPKWARWTIMDQYGITYKPTPWPVGIKSGTWTNDDEKKRTFYIRVELPQSDKDLRVNIQKYQTQDIPLKETATARQIPPIPKPLTQQPPIVQPPAVSQIPPPVPLPPFKKLLPSQEMVKVRKIIIPPNSLEPRKLNEP